MEKVGKLPKRLSAEDRARLKKVFRATVGRIVKNGCYDIKGMKCVRKGPYCPGCMFSL